MLLDVLGLLSACSYALDCVEAELVHVSDKHAKRVAYMSVCMAEQLGISDESLQDLAACALLHDNALTQYIQEELHKDVANVPQASQVGIHCTLGEKNIQRLPFHTDVKNVILYHHENYDGTGYPANLAGEKIPFGARILRICDVYCALTSDRPYRSAFTRKQAMELMTEEVKNFDLKMFLAFQRVIHSGSRKAIELSDVDELIREIIKEKTENGIKKETGYRNERYFTERNGNP